MLNPNPHALKPVTPTSSARCLSRDMADSFFIRGRVSAARKVSGRAALPVIQGWAESCSARRRREEEMRIEARGEGRGGRFKAQYIENE